VKYISKNPGKLFEEDFKKSIPKDVYYLRLKDPAQSFNPNEESKLRFSLKNPYDALLFKDILMCLELKSTSQTSFSFETEAEYLKRKEDKKNKIQVKPNSKMIKYHQLLSLLETLKYKKIISGFIFNIRKENNLDKTYFLYVKEFNKFMNETTKVSINEKDIIQYGAIEVEGNLKRTRYQYNIEKMIEDIIHKYTE